MKIRIFKNVCNSVVRVVVNTEGFSQEEVKLMCQFGEPEVNVGGFNYPGTVGNVDTENGEKATSLVAPEVALGDEFVRIMHGFPYSMGFDMRDHEGSSLEAMMEMADSWVGHVCQQIESLMSELRDKRNQLPTEEVINV